MESSGPIDYLTDHQFTNKSHRTHVESLCFWFCNDTSGFKVEISNAARHG